jgi:hypothetical protein
LIHAEVTLRSVELARLRPTFTASSKLVSDLALISVTRATVPATMTSWSQSWTLMITAVTHLTPAARCDEGYPGLSLQSEIALDQSRQGQATTT